MTAVTDDGYAAIADLLERQLALVAERDFAAVDELMRERRQLAARLPERPPASAWETLRRCELLQQRLTIELARVRDSILLELRAVRHAQRTAAGYRPPRQRIPTISASA
jgi:hypothetical protein